MSLTSIFDESQVVEREGISVSIKSGALAVTFHGSDVVLRQAQIALLAKLVQKTDSGVTPEDYSALRGKRIEDYLDYRRTLDVMKVHISRIRQALEDSSPDTALPLFTTLYGKYERMHEKHAKEGAPLKQAYILSAPMSDKPAYSNIRNSLPNLHKTEWGLFIDVVASETIPDFRVYKRRIHDWRDGIVCIGEQAITMPRLATAALAQTLLARGAPSRINGGGRLYYAFGDAADNGETVKHPLLTYRKLMGQAITSINEQAGMSAAASNLAILSKRQGNLALLERIPTFG